MSRDTATPPSVQSSWAKTAVMWIVIGLLACMFVLSGVVKFVNPEAPEQFANFGYEDWFRVLIGVAEIGGGLLLLAPRTTFYGAAALGIIMLGAVYTHLAHGQVPQALVPLVLFGLLAYVGYARRPRFANP
jgi:putative oxidoreductase